MSVIGCTLAGANLTVQRIPSTSRLVPWYHILGPEDCELGTDTCSASAGCRSEFCRRRLRCPKRFDLHF